MQSHRSDSLIDLKKGKTVDCEKSRINPCMDAALHAGTAGNDHGGN